MAVHPGRRLTGPRRGANVVVPIVVAASLAACTGAVNTAGELSWAEGLGAMAIIFVGVASITIFIALFADIFRRHDLSGGAKAGWTLLLVVFPLLGSLIYIIARPKMTDADRVMVPKPTELSESEMVAQLNRLKAQGKISDADYEEEMRHVRPSTPP